MSSRRIIASSAAMATVVLLTGWYAASAFPLTALAAIETAATGAAVAGSQQPPRDTRPGRARPATSREQELQTFVAEDPNGPMSKSAYFELAKLQEARAATSEAEATLQAARTAFPNDSTVLNTLARFYTRRGDFDRAVAVIEDAAALDPSNPQGHQLVATYYQEKVQKDHSLTPTEKLTYIQKGIDAADRALAMNPEYVDAMIYKNILLRHQANIEPDPSRQAQLIADADVLRNKAMELNKARGAAVRSGAPPPPPPPPGPAPIVDGQTAIRIGGEIKPPTKIRDVRPVYPPEAMGARVQGVVIAEVTVDSAGMVRDARLLRSIPMLDDAALEAVRQWQFTPTMLNGTPVPVVLTVTVNFTLQ